MAKRNQSWQQTSRVDWSQEVEDDGKLHLTFQEVGVGCLQRIAAALEKSIERLDSRLLCLGRTLSELLALQRREARKRMKRDVLKAVRREQRLMKN